MEDVQLSLAQSRIIWRLLGELGEAVPVDLVGELGIVDPDAYIKHLQSRFIEL